MMALKGFFTIKSTEKPKLPAHLSKYNKPGEADCSSCGLYKIVKNPKIGLRGEGKKGILILLEGPGRTEDIKNDNLVGEVGIYLEDKLSKLGINMRKDCKIINSVNCRPIDKKGGNRKPTDNEIRCCRPLVLKAIEDFKPKVIWLMGGPSLKSYLMDRFSKLEISRWLSWIIPDTEKECWVMPIYHPSYPYRTKQKNQNLNTEYDRLLNKLVSETKKLLKQDRPKLVNYEEQIKPLYEYSHIIDRLKYILKEKPPIVLDYETDGKKPHKKGHKIYVVSIDDGKLSTPFPFQKPGFWTEKQLGTITYLLKKILMDPDIEKTAANMKFEMVWSEVILDIITAGWYWCTMINAHILSSRQGITGLKFQTFVRFGVYGYDKDVKHLLETDTEFNRIDEVPIDKLLLYCGKDTLFTRMLRAVQEKEFAEQPFLLNGAEFYRDSHRSLVNMQKVGMPASEQYYVEEGKKIADRMDFIEKQLMKSKEAILFRKKTGRPLKINSGKDLQHLLFDIMGLKSAKQTKTGESTDIEALTKIDVPFTKRILTLRKLKKIKDTYFAQFLREIQEDKIHATCNLHIARSYRSTMMDPNLQNIPRRDEMAKKYCRSGIIPSKGNRIGEYDFGSHEVRIAACYSEDPVLYEYIVDPKGTDMHRDQGAEIFLIPQSFVEDMVRFYIKNNWVFPEFYGSWFGECAQNLWINVVEGGLKTTEGQTIKKHLLSKDIRTLDHFKNHCKKVEARFWDKYKVFRKWQEKVLKTYLEKGYVELFHGFRRGGFLNKNRIINTPVQGTAYHCLQWSLNKVDEIKTFEEWNTSIINQVHDSIKFDLNPHEQDHVTKTLKRVAEVDIRKEYPWIIVPLEIEPEWTPINGNWYQKEKVEYINGNWTGKKSKKIYNLEY